MTNTLQASIEIAAKPDAVWKVVSDLERMGKWSPQCKVMKVLGGPLRQGSRTVNVNKKGVLVWPTSAKVIRVEPGKAIAWRVTENHTIWTYELTETESGTRVESRREAPTGTTKVSSFLVDKFMGGTAGFETDMIAGMNTTLARIKSDVETGAAHAR